jgi:threonine/homoserine/homoserine lactone efflux protein
MRADALWIIFSFSFLLALSGAIMPGPLFTYTIARTMQTRRNGFFVGAWVTAGHAALEILIILGLVIGVVEFLKVPLVIKIIAVAGALLLGYMGVGLIREALRKGSADPFAAGRDSGVGVVGRMSPVLAGVLVSMSNPYWWVWWVTVGSASLMRFGVSLANWQGLAAFFLGHEAADLGWYVVVSTLTHFGRRTLSGNLYRAVLAVCGVVIIGFGGYLVATLFLKGS